MSSHPVHTSRVQSLCNGHPSSHIFSLPIIPSCPAPALLLRLAAYRKEMIAKVASALQRADGGIGNAQTLKPQEAQGGALNPNTVNGGSSSNGAFLLSCFIHCQVGANGCSQSQR